MREFTDKQKLYLHCLALDLSDTEIALRLNIGPDTVITNYRDRMIAKTYLYTRSDLVEYAKKHGYGAQEYE